MTQSRKKVQPEDCYRELVRRRAAAWGVSLKEAGETLRFSIMLWGTLERLAREGRRGPRHENLTPQEANETLGLSIAFWGNLKRPESDDDEGLGGD